LDLAEVCDTLVADADGVYRPGLFNDRMLLGMKGLMSEAELHVLRARLDGGIRAKAARGELRLRLRWKGGAISELSVPIKRQPPTIRTGRDIIALVRRLAIHPGRHASDGAVVLVLDPYVACRGRSESTCRRTRLDRGLLIGGDHVAPRRSPSGSGRSGRPLGPASPRSPHRGKIHDRHRHGRIAFSESYRRMVVRRS